MKKVQSSFPQRENFTSCFLYFVAREQGSLAACIDQLNWDTVPNDPWTGALPAG